VSSGILDAGGKMAIDYAVVKVKGLEAETFVVIGVDWGAGQIKSLTREMSEKNIREHLKKAGVSETTINSSIESARKDPK
jgi:hypothetical protein